MDPAALGHPRVRLVISPVHVAYLVRVGHEQGKLPGLAIDQVERVGVGLATWGIKCRPSMKLTHLLIWVGNVNLNFKFLNWQLEVQFSSSPVRFGSCRWVELLVVG